MIPHETSKEIVKTYLLTLSVKETARQLNYSYSWVYKVLYRSGLINVRFKKTTTSIKDLNDKQISCIIQEYCSKFPVHKILQKHNISRRVLYVLLGKERIPLRNKQKVFNWNTLTKELKAELIAEIIILHSKGKTVNEIARELGIPPSRARNTIKELSVPTTSTKGASWIITNFL